jgi:hypothetical protein
MRRIMVLVLIGLGTTAVSKSAAAQSCGYLQWCWESVHKMPPSYNGFYDTPHESCNVCPGYILDCHKECGISDDLIAQSAVRSAVIVALEGDVNGVVALAHLAPQFIRYNSQRGAVQIMGCDKNVVLATLQVRNQALATELRKLTARVAEFEDYGSTERRD